MKYWIENWLNIDFLYIQPLASKEPRFSTVPITLERTVHKYSYFLDLYHQKQIKNHSHFFIRTCDRQRVCLIFSFFLVPTYVGTILWYVYTSWLILIFECQIYIFYVSNNTIKLSQVCVFLRVIFLIGIRIMVLAMCEFNHD